MSNNSNNGDVAHPIKATIEVSPITTLSPMIITDSNQIQVIEVENTPIQNNFATVGQDIAIQKRFARRARLTNACGCLICIIVLLGIIIPILAFYGIIPFGSNLQAIQMSNCSLPLGGHVQGFYFGYSNYGKGGKVPQQYEGASGYAGVLLFEFIPVNITASTYLITDASRFVLLYSSQWGIYTPPSDYINVNSLKTQQGAQWQITFLDKAKQYFYIAQLLPNSQYCYVIISNAGIVCIPSPSPPQVCSVWKFAPGPSCSSSPSQCQGCTLDSYSGSCSTADNYVGQGSS